MTDFVQDFVAKHISISQLVAQQLSPQVSRVGREICHAFTNGKKILTFGNGGSAADAQHLAEELIGRYQLQRRPLPAISLTSDAPALTCIANDFGYEEIFARQVTALANPGDVVVGFSTSGNSENVLRGLGAAREKSAVTIGMLGRDGGKAARQVDHAIIVPADVTAHIQEMHVMIVHMLCHIVDEWSLGK